ncbi:hypothetical protein EZS27_015091 [termite gut metagenome]|uniref:DUF5723 domain-containing protein n=1 Tax=termite gut metagenome TaxID=433724 RepID=A0A5J4RV41_9ZZZZ
MKYKVTFITTALLMLFAVDIPAQVLRSNYFLEGVSLRHQMNPSFMGENSYISFPLIGNTAIDIHGNVGLSNFVYKYDDPVYSLTTFLNSAINGNTFLKKLPANNKVSANLSLTLFSIGFYKWAGFNTFELGIKSNTSFNIPKSLFDFMKTGMNDKEKEYHIKNLDMRTNNYAELAFGHSRIIDEGLQIGGKFKILIGGANVRAHMDDMVIKMSENEWEVSARGNLDVSVKGGSFKTIDTKKTQETIVINETQETIVIKETGGEKEVGVIKETKETITSNETIIRKKIDGFDLNSPGIGGWGAGIDFGVTYNIHDNLIVSAAILDFGFITWGNSLKGYNNGTPFKFEGFDEFAAGGDIEDSNNKSIKDQVADIKGDLKDALLFYEKEEKGKRTTMLATTLNLGAEYIYPDCEQLSFGALSSTRFNGRYTWSEMRLSANVKPVDWFNTALTCGLSNYGSSLGWAFNFHPTGFNFYAGFDYMVMKLTPQFIPVNRPNLLANMGFGFTF